MNPKPLVALVLAACSSARAPLPHETTPGVVFPHHLAEGRGGGGPPRSVPPPPPLPPGSAAATSSSAAPPAAPALRLSPPDPEPLRMAEQYELRLAYQSGDVTVEAVRAMIFRQPVVTARNMGRFAVELWIGRELIDRVRFDFPLLTVEEPAALKKRPLREPPSFGGKLAVTILVPASTRVRRAVVLDRATGRETELTWPPAVTAPPAAPTAPAAPTPSSAAPSAAPSEPARPR